MASHGSAVLAVALFSEITPETSAWDMGKACNAVLPPSKDVAQLPVPLFVRPPGDLRSKRLQGAVRTVQHCQGSLRTPGLFWHLHYQ